ncbi:MAG: hypothetical protein KIS67_16575 [Verrucomicrobiae bacterium]|nr:hypothetical protein [Verrucomicrobiae bacterium]
MNDDFESKLQRQRLRRIPAEWRAEILAAAEAERRPTKLAGVTLASLFKQRLRELFWPAPQAWAGLATLWLVVLVLNFATREAAPDSTSRSAPPSPEMLRLLKQQEQLLAELVDQPDFAAVGRPKAAPLGPRSGRREETLNA